MSTKFIDFGELKARICISDVALSMLGLKLRPDGRKLRGPCPFCEDDRSFRITPDAGADGLGMYGCFKCGERGDAIQLVHVIRQTAKVNDAARLIEEHFGSRVPPASAGTHLPEKKEKAGSTCPILEFTPDNVAKAAELLDLSQKTLEHFGVGGHPAGYATSGVMRGYVAVGVHDRDGALLVYAGIPAKEGQQPDPKFGSKQFDPASVIFNAHRITPGPLVVVRNPLLVLSAFESGEDNVVCFLTEQITAQQLESLASLMDQKGCETVSFF